MTEKICFITGVGGGTGEATARGFAADGYRVAMLARDAERLAGLEADIPGARSFPCDVSDIEALEAVCSQVQEEMGVPDVLVHNAARGTFKGFLDGNLADLERNFRVNTTALLHLGRAFAPAMIARGSGAIIVTGNTAALRGVPSYALFAPTKAAQRILAQAMARELGPKGVHVAYVLIDAAIDAPWTRDRIYPNKSDDFFSMPADIAEEIFHVAHQARSTWSFDVEIRPYGERW